MAESNSLINLGELSKPATVLIGKISDAIGGVFRPYQIRRIAQAETEAEKIKALSQIEITEIQQRALFRFVAEEAKKQSNIESITQQSIPLLEQNASPDKVEDDWITNFFDKCRLVSDAEMQTLWAKLLAGEANRPGTISRRTVAVLASLDKTDAELFRSLCRFGWMIAGVTVLIYDVEHEIYKRHGINFGSLKHLDEIGLISFETLAGFKRRGFRRDVVVLYYGEPVHIRFPNDTDNELEVGKVLFSKAGQELAAICGAEKSVEFKDYIITKWRGDGLVVDSLLSQNAGTPQNS